MLAYAPSCVIIFSRVKQLAKPYIIFIFLELVQCLLRRFRANMLNLWFQPIRCLYAFAVAFLQFLEFSSVNRITIKTLDAVVARLNAVLNMPATYSEKGTTLGANVGHHTISRAYGGFALHRVSAESGSVSDVFRCGHVTARDLYNRLHAMLEGIAAKG